MSACLGLLSQDAESAGTHLMRRVHCWSELYCSQVREGDVEQLRIVDAYSCVVTVAPSKIKRCNAGLGVLATRTVKQGVVADPYYKTIVYHNLSSRQPARKGYEG